MSADRSLTAVSCPKCRGDLVVYERQGIVIDQCRDCRGIWLDRGELEHLIDLETRAASRSNGYRDDRTGPEWSDQRAARPYAEPWPAGRSEPRSWDDDDDDRDDDRYDGRGRDPRGDGRSRRRQGFLGDLLEGFLE